MVIAGAKIKFTYEDYCHAPEGKRYELHDGDLVVVPSPKEQHQDSVGSLYYFLRAFVQGRELGRVYIALSTSFSSTTMSSNPMSFSYLTRGPASSPPTISKAHPT